MATGSPYSAFPSLRSACLIELLISIVSRVHSTNSFSIISHIIKGPEKSTQFSSGIQLLYFCIFTSRLFLVSIRVDTKKNLRVRLPVRT